MNFVHDTKGEVKFSWWSLRRGRKGAEFWLRWSSVHVTFFRTVANEIFLFSIHAFVWGCERSKAVEMILQVEGMNSRAFNSEKRLLFKLCWLCVAEFAVALMDAVQL